MNRISTIRRLLCCCLLVGLSECLCLGSLTFVRGEVALFDPGVESLTQSSLDVHFDQSNRLHAVFSDERDSGFQHIFGTTMLRNGVVTQNFQAYIPPLNSDLFDNGQILSLPGYPDQMFMLGIDTTSSTLSAVVSSWDLSTLPAPTVTNLNSSVMLGTGITYLDTAASGDYLFYVYSYNGLLYLNRYSVAFNSWDTTETVIFAADKLLFAPHLVADDAGFLYLGYQQFDSIGSTWDFVVRRSLMPLNPAPGFLVEHMITMSPRTSQFPHIDLAVTGDSVSGTLKVATAYQDPLVPDKTIVASVEHNGDWSDPGWVAGYSILNGAPGSSTLIRGPDLAFGVNKIFLYAVWFDNRAGGECLFGAISFTGGLTWQRDRQLTYGTPVLQDPPQIITGYSPGNLAVAYTRNTGVGISPHALVIMPVFYDPCDDDPAAYWNTFTGVTPVILPFHGLQGRSYEMANGSDRGQLLRDFGSQENHGSVDLYFYDDVGNVNEDFFIGLDNNNRRGVIRMLGVRNESTTYNYSYFDGSNWIDWGSTAARSTGWHHVMLTVNEAGLYMSLEYTDGEYATWYDSTYTSFTAVFIEGGSDAEPYYVDDVQVEVLPLESPLELPAASPLFLTLLLAGVSLLIHRSR